MVNSNIKIRVYVKFICCLIKIHLRNFQGLNIISVNFQLSKHPFKDIKQYPSKARNKDLSEFVAK